MKNSTFIICAITCIYAHATNQELLVQALYGMRQHITLSNFTPQEREANCAKVDYAIATIKHIQPHVIMTPEHIPAWIHLAYKVANCLQQNSRGLEAYFLLNNVYQTVHEILAITKHEDSLDLCLRLSSFHPMLPAYYAALLHFMGKSYFYCKHFHISCAIAYHQAYSFIERALALRHVIDTHPAIMHDAQDSNAGNDASHTILFQRTLSYLLEEQGLFEQEISLLTTILDTATTPFEHCYAHCKLALVYLQWAKQTLALHEYRARSQKAIGHVQEVEQLLTHYPQYEHWFGLKLYIASFYAHNDNPFQNYRIATDLASCIVQQSPRNEHIMQAQGLLCLMHPETSSALKNQYLLNQRRAQEQRFMNAIHHQTTHSHRSTTFCLLAEHYTAHKEFITAAYVLGIALKLASQDACCDQCSARIYLQLQRNEQAFLADDSHQPTLQIQQINHYRAYLESYRQQIDTMRHALRSTISRATAYEDHDVLTKHITSIYQRLWQDACQMLPITTIDAACIAFGSLAHHTPSAYSDIEFAVVYDKTASDLDKERIKKIITIFLMRILALGEKPISESPLVPLKNVIFAQCAGIRFDGGGVIGHSFPFGLNLYGTIEEIRERVRQYGPPLLFALQESTLIDGSGSLLQQFRTLLQELTRSVTAQQWAALCAMDISQWCEPIIKVDGDGLYCYSPKHTLLRPLTIIASQYAIRNGLGDENLLLIAQEIIHTKSLPQDTFNAVNEAYKTALYTRSLHDLVKQSQADYCMINTNNYLEELQPIITVHRGLRPLVTAYDNTLEHVLHGEHALAPVLLCRTFQFDHARNLLQHYQDQSWAYELQGDMALIEGNGTQAYRYYIQALNMDSSDLLLHAKLAQAASIIGDYHIMQHHCTLLQQYVDQIPEPLHNILVYTLRYLRGRLARLQGDTQRALRELDYTDFFVHKKIISKPGALTHALIIYEYGMTIKTTDPAAAQQSFELARDIIIRKYGLLHPVLCPIYQELFEIAHKKEQAQAWDYHEKLSKIHTLFSSIIHWFPLNKALLD